MTVPAYCWLAGTSRNDPECLRTVPYVSGQHRTLLAPTRDEEETRGH